MPNLPPAALAVIVAVSLAVWAGTGIVHGVKKAGHAIGHVATKLVHPHKHSDQ